MNKSSENQVITSHQIVTALYQCHSSLEQIYRSHKLMGEELFHIGELAKVTGDLVKIGIEKE
ncbi:MAG: hypothetical protein CK423_06760 [Legionella sp.]|nr:MAG: hypothetical protein CK423_06760 [Legionella sp.]